MFLNYSHTSSQHTAATALPGTEPGEKLEDFSTLSLSLDWRRVEDSNLDLGFLRDRSDGQSLPDR